MNGIVLGYVFPQEVWPSDEYIVAGVHGWDSRLGDDLIMERTYHTGYCIDDCFYELHLL